MIAARRESCRLSYNLLTQGFPPTIIIPGNHTWRFDTVGYCLA